MTVASQTSLQFPIYLDHSASTPVDARAFGAMRPYFTEIYGNAASSHGFGQSAAAAVARARNQVASLLNVEVDERAGAREIIWTSGATESNNLAIKGVAAAYRDKGRHIITQVTEHKSVIDACKRLADQGWEITWLPVDSAGRVSPEHVVEAIRPDTVLASIMWANNETGTIQPMREIGLACRERGVLLHSDATQAVGKIPVDVQANFVDLLSITGHKFYGPKGCGGLFVRRKEPRVRLIPQSDGGGHERGFRSGTLNVPGIVGVGAVCEINQEQMADDAARHTRLRDRLQTGIEEAGGITVNGDTSCRLPHVCNLSFSGIEGEALMPALSQIAVSSASACSSASLEASYVLRAMGISPDVARNSIRFSLGRATTEDQIEYVITTVRTAIARLRAAGGNVAPAGGPAPAGRTRAAS
jgi:cysteine desulfurase